MKKTIILLSLSALLVIGVYNKELTVFNNIKASSKTPEINFKQYLANCPIALSFDFPVGPPDANQYYNAQPFGKNNHLGDDWNGIGGGNTDLGDPIFSVGEGIVIFAADLKGGWGNVVRVCHNIGTNEDPHYIESLYAHLQKMSVKPGEHIKKGQQIGTIGNANGKYLAHLHLEIRNTVGLPLGRGYGQNNNSYLDPTAFINSNR